MENSLEKELRANFTDGESGSARTFTFAGALEIAKYFHHFGLQKGREEAVEFIRGEIPKVHGDEVHKQELEEILKETSPERREG